MSLNDLLFEHQAPEVIDYMSIDTEGSELAILEGFDFSRHRIRCMTVEHNFTDNEKKLDSLMKANHFRRVLRNYSKWDGFYVNEPR